MAMEYTVKGEWVAHESGQKYVAKAVARAGRILAVATVDVPIDVGHDFVSYYGSEELKDVVENTAQEQVKKLADATPQT